MLCVCKDTFTVHSFNSVPKTQDVRPVNLKETCLVQLPDDGKEWRGYWKLKEEALDRTSWRIRFITGYGPVVKTDCV
jgi:hypothetical protein